MSGSGSSSQLRIGAAAVICLAGALGLLYVLNSWLRGDLLSLAGSLVIWLVHLLWLAWVVVIRVEPFAGQADPPPPDQAIHAAGKHARFSSYGMFSSIGLWVGLTANNVWWILACLVFVRLGLTLRDRRTVTDPGSLAVRLLTLLVSTALGLGLRLLR